MSSRPFRLGRSLTGLGLFATKPIKKRTRIAENKGPLLDVKAAEKAEMWDVQGRLLEAWRAPGNRLEGV